MSPADEGQTFNPWSVVNLVFTHLVDQGLRPTFGDGGDPAPAARALLEALGVQPSHEGNQQVVRDVRDHLSEIRQVMLDDG